MKSLFLGIIFLVLSCSSTKRIYNYDKCLGIPEKYQNEVLKKKSAVEDNFSLLFFTSNFIQDTIVISNNDTILLDDIITSDPVLGLATYLRINNDYDTKILLKNINLDIIIEKNKYKFIYISRRIGKEKFEIRYSNKLCGFR